MSLSSTTNRVTYTGDGTSAVFLFPYEFSATSDLLVYLQDQLSGLITNFTLNVDYTVTATPNNLGIYPNGGSITTTTTASASSILTITRSPARTQNYTLGPNSTISGPALVNQFDYMTMLIQRLHDISTRSIRLKDGVGSTFSTLLPDYTALRAGSVLVVNSSGMGLEWQLSTGSSAFSGVLGISNGGTGTTVTPNVFGVMYAASLLNYATTAPGAPGYVLTANASSAPSFQATTITLGTSTKNANYNATVVDSFIETQSSGFTINLYGATGNSGKTIRVKKTDSTIASVTIAASSALISFGGTSVASTTISTYGEEIDLVCDGVGWLGRRYINSSWNLYTPIIGGKNAPPGEAAGATKVGRWRRVGDSVEVSFLYAQTTAGSSSNGTHLYSLPSGITIDSGKISTGTSEIGTFQDVCGFGQVSNVQSSTVSTATFVHVYAFNDNLNLFLARDAAGTNLVTIGGGGVGGFGATALFYNFKATVPVSGWNG